MSDDKKIESMMQEKRLFAPPAAGQKQAHVKSMADYEALYKRSMEDPEGFWADRAKELLTWENRGPGCLRRTCTSPRSNGSRAAD